MGGHSKYDVRTNLYKVHIHGKESRRDRRRPKQSALAVYGQQTRAARYLAVKCLFLTEPRRMETRQRCSTGAHWRRIKIKQQGLGPSFLHTTYDNGAQTNSHLASPANPADFRRPGIGGQVRKAFTVSFFDPCRSQSTTFQKDFFILLAVLLFTHTERSSLLLFGPEIPLAVHQ